MAFWIEQNLRPNTRLVKDGKYSFQQPDGDSDATDSDLEDEGELVEMTRIDKNIGDQAKKYNQEEIKEFLLVKSSTRLDEISEHDSDSEEDSCLLLQYQIK